jgi:hypothetical protein
MQGGAVTAALKSKKAASVLTKSNSRFTRG